MRERFAAPGRPALPRYERLLLVPVLLLAAWLFWRELLSVPPGLEMDELIEAEIAQQILTGDWRLFYAAGQGREPLFHYWLALWFALVGPTLFALRMASTTVSLLALAAGYRLARALFGPAVTIASAAFGLSTFWMLFAARSGLRSTTLPLVASVAGFLFWRGLHARAPLQRSMTLIAAGAALGLAFYTYTAGRVLPFVFLGFVVYLLLFHCRLLRERIVALTAAGLVALALLLPLLIYLRAHPEADEFAFMDFNRPLVALQAGNPAPALDTTLSTAGMFTHTGDPLIFDNIPGRPVFSRAVSAFFVAGLLLALWRWRRPPYALLLIWLPVTLLPGMLSQPAPNFYRTVGAQPVAALPPAIALAALYRAGAAYLADRRVLRVSAALALIALAGTQLAQTWRDYFTRWPQVEGVHFFWQASLFETARFLDRQPRVRDAAICTTLVNEVDPWWRPAAQSLPYLLQRQDMRARFFDCRQTFVAPAADPLLYVLPDDIALASLPPPFRQPFENGQALAGALPPGHGSIYSLSPADLATARRDVFLPPEAGSHSAELPVQFGGDLALVGYDYLGDERTPGAQLRLLTQWQVMDTPPANLALFTHVMSDPQTVVAQQDALPLTTSSLQPGDPFWVLHDQLWLPSAEAGDSYLVAIGLYDRTNLVRLPLAGAEQMGADRLFLAPVVLDAP